MFKTLTATALAATIALTGTTSRAVAASDADRIAGLIFGAAALALIVKNLDDRNDRPNHHVSRNYSHAPVITPQNNRPDRQNNRNRTRTVPKSCERELQTGNGERRVFGLSCVNQWGYSARLPQQCLRTIQLHRGTFQAYGKRCLLNNGVRVSG